MANDQPSHFVCPFCDIVLTKRERAENVCPSCKKQFAKESSVGQNLGEICHIFKPSMANIGAGAILGLALLLGGITLCIYLPRQPDPNPHDNAARIARYASIGIVGGGATIGGIALLVGIKRLASHILTVHENGFSCVYAGSTDTCLWTELEKISEVFTREQIKILKIPGASIKQIDRRFVLYRNDGKTFSFTINSIGNISRFAECLEKACEKSTIKWEQTLQ